MALDILIIDDEDDIAHNGAAQSGATKRPEVVPIPLAMQGPGRCAWHLVTEAHCTEERTDAVALLALELQEKFADPLVADMLAANSVTRKAHDTLHIGIRYRPLPPGPTRVQLSRSTRPRALLTKATCRC